LKVAYNYYNKRETRSLIMPVTSVHQLTIAALSVLCVDHYPQQGLVRPGGNTLNFAVNARRFGAGKVSVAGFIGNDPEAEIVLRCLKDEEIDSSNVFQLKGKTASNQIFNTPDGERYSTPGSWNNGVKDSGIFSEKTWNFLLSHTIIALPYTDKNIEEILQRRTKNNMLIIDFLHFDNPEIVQKYLPFFDVLFVSPAPGKVNALRKLVSKSDSLLVTMLGANGSKAFKSGKEFIQPAFNIHNVVDTTGCGDAYQAGFICSYALDGDIQKAMLTGTITATNVLTHYGGV